jgi:hypothetical protein
MCQLSRHSFCRAAAKRLTAYDLFLERPADLGAARHLCKDLQTFVVRHTLFARIPICQCACACGYRKKVVGGALVSSHQVLKVHPELVAFDCGIVFWLEHFSKARREKQSSIRPLAPKNQSSLSRLLLQSGAGLPEMREPVANSPTSARTGPRSAKTQPAHALQAVDRGSKPLPGL